MRPDLSHSEPGRALFHHARGTRCLSVQEEDELRVTIDSEAWAEGSAISCDGMISLSC